jgi:hypothetical protein
MTAVTVHEIAEGGDGLSLHLVRDGDHVRVEPPRAVRGLADHRDVLAGQEVGRAAEVGRAPQEPEDLVGPDETPGARRRALVRGIVVLPFKGDGPAVDTALGIRQADTRVYPGPDRQQNCRRRAR